MSTQSQIPAGSASPEKYLIAFVIQGDDVFKITADNIVHTTGTANGPAFDAIAKLKAAAALLELTNRHKERPDELRQMARELAGEGMKLMARASSAIRPVPPPAPVEEEVPVVRAAATPAPDPEREVQPPPVVRAAPATAGVPPRVAPPAPVPPPVQTNERKEEATLFPNHSKIALIHG